MLTHLRSPPRQNQQWMLSASTPRLPNIASTAFTVNRRRSGAIWMEPDACNATAASFTRNGPHERPAPRQGHLYASLVCDGIVYPTIRQPHDAIPETELCASSALLRWNADPGFDSGLKNIAPKPRNGDRRPAVLVDSVFLALLAMLVGAVATYAALALFISTGVVQDFFYGFSHDHVYSGLAYVSSWHIVAAPALGGLLVDLIVYRLMPQQRNYGPADVMQAVREKDAKMSIGIGLGSAAVSILSIGAGASAGTAVAHAYLGDIPIFAMADYEIQFAHEYPLFAIVGLLGGGLAIAFMRGMDIGTRIVHRTPIPLWARPMFGGFLLGLIALQFPQVIGLGDEVFPSTLDFRVPARAAWCRPAHRAGGAHSAITKSLGGALCGVFNRRHRYSRRGDSNNSTTGE